MPKIGVTKKRKETRLAQHWQVGARHAEDRGDEKKIETTLAQHWQVGARHAEDRGDEKKNGNNTCATI